MATIDKKPLPIEDKRAWLASYKATSEALAQIRTAELAAMTDEQALMASLVTAETPWRAKPNWSGLVEQQAIFHRRKTR
jgi:hypothetical protein